jgi:succinate dehydrogenase hydrophobic anchor subunit
MFTTLHHVLQDLTIKKKKKFAIKIVIVFNSLTHYVLFALSIWRITMSKNIKL